MFIAPLSTPVNLISKVYLKNADSYGRGRLLYKKLNSFTINRSPVARKFRNCENLHASPKLTPLEVNNLLQANEFTKEFSPGVPIKSYDTNQLPSNDPMEDTRTEAQCISNNGYLFGVFDGHGGGACAQVVAKRLYYYIMAYFLSQQQLHVLHKSISNSDSSSIKLLEFYNEKFEFVDVLRNFYTKSYQMFIEDLLNSGATENLTVENILERSFLRLDADISREATETEVNDRLHSKTLSVAMSGAVSCIAYVTGPHLYVASAGDCQAVIGSLADNEQWNSKILSVQHNADNEKEVNRILKEHPKSEEPTIIKGDRLLGQLAPLRAFGDFRYKWNKATLQKIAGPFYGVNAIPADYHTPPYLTAKPDITYHHLTTKDKFLVLATDGLWDFISPQQVVRLVGEHMRGKSVLTPFHLPKENMTLGEINEALLVRKECLTIKPIDTNVCTHLLRNALGGTEYGLDHGRISQFLSLPQDVVRGFRDDISITVVYFDSNFIRWQSLNDKQWRKRLLVAALVLASCFWHRRSLIANRMRLRRLGYAGVKMTLTVPKDFKVGKTAFWKTLANIPLNLTDLIRPKDLPAII